MPAAAPQQGNQNDSGLGVLWMIIGIFVLGLLIWYFGHSYIVLGVFYIKLFQICLVSFFSPGLEGVRQWMYMNWANPGQVSFDQLVVLSRLVGDYLAIPIAALLGLLAIIIYTSSVSVRYKTTYSMKKLREDEQTNWPQISPINKLNLAKEPIDKGPWAMPLSPMEFAKKYNLLKEEVGSITEEQLMKEAKIVAVLKRQTATRIFTLQIGPVWRGVERLPVYAQALFAIFAARANHDTDAASALLKQIAQSSSGAQLNFSGAKNLLNKYLQTKPVQFILQRHAYVFTVMASMLEIARTDGVLSTADFLWLKPLDRRLWYMLNTVGRQTAVSEIAGAYAHWITEKEIGRRLVVPMVETATNALEQALLEITYKPSEDSPLLRGQQAA